MEFAKSPGFRYSTIPEKKMEDEDIEYDITFPSPVSNPNQEWQDPRVLTHKVEPVVILLGWLGCKEKHLAKYAQIYDQKGCITISYTAPNNVAFFDVKKLKDIACKVLDLLNDYSVADNPVIFHIFSNNGSYVYYNIVKVLTSGDDRYKKIQVLGVIIDSAPGKPRFSKAAVAYSWTLKTNIFFKYFMVLGMMVYLFFSHVRSRMSILFYPETKKTNEHFLYDNMAEDPTRWPMMFLYSKTDKVVYSDDIEEMMMRRQALGIHVDSVCFKDTDHVSHFRLHASEYTDACSDFAAFCLGITDEDGDEEEVEEEGEEVEIEPNNDYLLSNK